MQGEFVQASLQAVSSPPILPELVVVAVDGDAADPGGDVDGSG
jgi:hypothetical protein